MRLVASRFSSHDTKLSVPVNEPPNDHFPFKVATIDDLPVPEGDYYENFKQQNRRYWRHFIFGVSWLAVSIYGVNHFSSLFEHVFSLCIVLVRTE